MRKRKNQWNASNEVETDVLEVELNDTSTEVELDEEIEIVLSESEINLEFEELEDVTEVIDADEIEDDISDDSKLELLEEVIDVEVDSDDNTEEVDQEARDPELTEDKQEELEEVTFDPADLVAAVSNVVNRIPEAGVMSVINSVKNGKRVSISREIMNKIGQLDSVQMGFMKNGIVIGQYLSDTNTSYQLRTKGAKKLIYSKGLVEQITEYFSLDFSNRTSITFHEATYQKLDGNIVAVINVK